VLDQFTKHAFQATLEQSRYQYLGTGAVWFFPENRLEDQCQLALSAAIAMSRSAPYQPLLLRLFHNAHALLVLGALITGFWVYNTYDGRFGTLST